MTDDTQEMLKRASDFSYKLRRRAHEATLAAWPLETALRNLRVAAARDNLAEIEEAQTAVRAAFVDALMAEAGL